MQHIQVLKVPAAFDDRRRGMARRVCHVIARVGEQAVRRHAADPRLDKTILAFDLQLHVQHVAGDKATVTMPALASIELFETRVLRREIVDHDRRHIASSALLERIFQTVDAIRRLVFVAFAVPEGDGEQQMVASADTLGKRAVKHD